MDSSNISKPKLVEKIKNRLAGWNLKKTARVVLYTGGVVFVIALVISAGRAPQTQTASTLSQAPAAFTVNKWYDYAGTATGKSGNNIKVHLRVRNPGERQAFTIRDYFPPGFTYIGDSVNCTGFVCSPNASGGTNYREWFFQAIQVPPECDDCEITYDLRVP